MRIVILRSQTVTVTVHTGGFVDDIEHYDRQLVQGEELQVVGVERGDKRKGGRISTVTVSVGPIRGARRYFEIAEADFRELQGNLRPTLLNPEWLPFMPGCREPFLPQVPGFTLLGVGEFSCPHDNKQVTCRVPVYRCEAFLQALVAVGLAEPDPEPGQWPETEFVLLPPSGHDGWFWGGTGMPGRRTMHLSGVFVTDPLSPAPPSPPDGDQRITQPFLIARTPLTAEVCQHVGESRGAVIRVPDFDSLANSHFSASPTRPNTPRLPQTNLSWHQANVWTQARGFQLPTQDEWEFACRGGTDAGEFFGRNRERLQDYAWCQQNSDGHAHPVATKPSNAYGLFDMLGNVQEWLAGLQRHPSIRSAEERAGLRVRIGGSWRTDIRLCSLGGITGEIDSTDVSQDDVGLRPIVRLGSPPTESAPG